MEDETTTTTTETPPVSQAEKDRVKHYPVIEGETAEVEPEETETESTEKKEA